MTKPVYTSRQSTLANTHQVSNILVCRSLDYQAKLLYYWYLDDIYEYLPILVIKPLSNQRRKVDSPT